MHRRLPRQPGGSARNPGGAAWYRACDISRGCAGCRVGPLSGYSILPEDYFAPRSKASGGRQAPVRKVPVQGLDSPAHLSLALSGLARHAEPDVEHLGVVAGEAVDRAAEVEGEGHRAEGGDLDAEAEACRGAVIADP